MAFSIKKQANLNFKKNTTFKIPRTPPISFLGLALWLKADTGVSTFSFNYISQIIITGTSNPSFAGTYTADGVPTYNLENGSVEPYYFTGPEGKTMFWDSSLFVLSASGEPEDSFSSTDGVNWNVAVSYIAQVVITGFTGIYSGANGTYNGDGYYFSRVGGGFFIEGDNLKDIDSESTIATAPVNYSGSWTGGLYNSSITLTGAGTISANGTYTRTDTEIIVNSLQYNGLGGVYIFHDGNWYVADNNGALYINTDYGELINWAVNGGGALNPPTGGSAGTSVRSVGSPTSTSTTYPSGSISGSVTTATVNTDEVTAWADQSENGNNATARTGNATLVSSVINGKPVLRFGGNANLITNNFFVHNYNTPITIIAVSKASASTVRGEQQTARYIAGVTNHGGYEFGLSYGAYETENPNFSNSYGISYVGGQDIESSPMGENEKRIASTINNGSEISFFLDGTLIGTADPADQSGGNNSTGAFSIGSDVVLDEIDDFFCVCDIAEIIIYNRAITTPERQQVEAYLNTKYQIY